MCLFFLNLGFLLLPSYNKAFVVYLCQNGQQIYDLWNSKFLKTLLSAGRGNQSCLQMRSQCQLLVLRRAPELHNYLKPGFMCIPANKQQYPPLRSLSPWRSPCQESIKVELEVIQQPGQMNPTGTIRCTPSSFHFPLLAMVNNINMKLVIISV